MLNSPSRSNNLRANVQLELTPDEDKLRRILLSVADEIDASDGCKEPVILRWAGGWVRDRLLGIESHDIDVAINNTTGAVFANCTKAYCDKLLEQPASERKHAITKSDIGSLYRVAGNPAKSKHLETAGFKLFQLELDFVNLRKETYADDSRNPQMEFGTAEEDATRRDATINALFYNLRTEAVEDFTGGIDDLDKHVIRTPLEPLQTFLDDPLRVLRLVRFASRLGFTIDSYTERFMGDARVLAALHIKISRERVGIELEKMLKGKHPDHALALMDRLNLYHAIFSSHDRDLAHDPDLSRWHIAYQCLSTLLQADSTYAVRQRLIQTEDDCYIAWTLAAVNPWMRVPEPLDPSRKQQDPVFVAAMARESFRASNKLVTVISASRQNLAEILLLKNAVLTSDTISSERDRFGMAIRSWDANGGGWRLQVLNAMLVEAADVLKDWTNGQNPAQDDFLQGWESFLEHLNNMDLYDAPNLKPLVDGRALAKALGVKPGRWMGEALKVCLAWQFRNPGNSDPANAVNEVRQRAAELSIPI